MIKERQIEEMAKDIEANQHIIDPCGKRKPSYQLARLLIQDGYHKSEWISVDERVPENNQSCLCTDGCYVGKVYYSKEFGFEDYAPFETVTHWMPLPKPPKMSGISDD